MNSLEKPLLIGEELAAPEQKELVQQLKDELQKLTDEKVGGRRKKWPMIRVDENGCWNFLGSKTKGYGSFNVQGTQWRVHRYFYFKLKGVIPDNLFPDHLCRNRGCCNPAHIELVTHRENTLRGTGLTAQNAKKTHCKRGHPFTERDVVKGGRGCRICKLELNRGYLKRDRKVQHDP